MHGGEGQVRQKKRARKVRRKVMHVHVRSTSKQVHIWNC